jgi:hypothetical protein
VSDEKKTACERHKDRQRPDTCIHCLWEESMQEHADSAQAERAAVVRWLRDSVQYQKWALPEDSTRQQFLVRLSQGIERGEHTEESDG